jgi:galactokinase
MITVELGTAVATAAVEDGAGARATGAGWTSAAGTTRAFFAAVA